MGGNRKEKKKIKDFKKRQKGDKSTYKDAKNNKRVRELQNTKKPHSRHFTSPQTHGFKNMVLSFFKHWIEFSSAHVLCCHSCLLVFTDDDMGSSF